MKDSKSKRFLRILNKALAILCLSTVLIIGLISKLPDIGAPNEQSSRNLFYHVPMWFVMMGLMYASAVYSIRVLNKKDLYEDVRAKDAAGIGVLFGFLGLITGIVWGRVTWAATLPDHDINAWWPQEPRLVTVMICLLIYVGYFILRGSVKEPMQRARVGAVFNIFAAASIMPLLYIIPKMFPGEHPNSKGGASVIFNLGSGYFYLFWTALIGFICLAIWIMDLRNRVGRMELTIAEKKAI